MMLADTPGFACRPRSLASRSPPDIATVGWPATIWRQRNRKPEQQGSGRLAAQLVREVEEQGGLVLADRSRGPRHLSVGQGRAPIRRGWRGADRRKITEMFRMDSESRDTERTLGFHLSSRTSFSDYSVCPARGRQRALVVDFGPPDDRRARQFPGLRRLRQRPDREAPVGGRDHPAGAVRRADRARQPPADARCRSTRRWRRIGTAHHGAAAARSRPVQGGQRHARPPDRRRIAQAGRAAAATRRSARRGWSGGWAATNSRSWCPARAIASDCPSSRRRSSPRCRSPISSTARRSRSAVRSASRSRPRTATIRKR